MHDIISVKVNDPLKSWDRFIEFLAADNSASIYHQLRNDLEWFIGNEPLATNLMKIYNPKLLKSDYYDHLGEIYTEKVISNNYAKKMGIFLTPKHVADTMAMMTIGETDKTVKVLDPAVGSGRLLMAAYKVAPNSHLFGVDIDIRLLRIAMTNFAIHDISGYFLNADSLKHETDISTEAGRSNWKYMNKWYSQFEHLIESNKSQNYSLNLNYDKNK